jgi:hypothetical protein
MLASSSVSPSCYIGSSRMWGSRYVSGAATVCVSVVWLLVRLAVVFRRGSSMLQQQAGSSASLNARCVAGRWALLLLSCSPIRSE